MTRRILSEDELQKLVFAYYTIEEARLLRLFTSILDGSKIEEPVISPGLRAYKSLFRNWITRVIARRLIQGDTSVPLLSEHDSTFSFPHYLEVVETEAGIRSNASEREYLKNIFMHGLSAARAVIPAWTESYTGFWKWIDTVLSLSEEQGLDLTDFLAQEDAGDQIARRVFSRIDFELHQVLMMRTLVEATVSIAKTVIDMTYDEYHLPPQLQLVTKKEIGRARLASLNLFKTETDRIFGKE